jgi:hypothetical protein
MLQGRFLARLQQPLELIVREEFWKLCTQAVLSNMKSTIENSSQQVLCQANEQTLTIA